MGDLAGADTGPAGQVPPAGSCSRTGVSVCSEVRAYVRVRGSAGGDPKTGPSLGRVNSAAGRGIPLKGVRFGKTCEVQGCLHRTAAKSSGTVRGGRCISVSGEISPAPGLLSRESACRQWAPSSVPLTEESGDRMAAGKKRLTALLACGNILWQPKRCRNESDRGEI